MSRTLIPVAILVLVTLLGIATSRSLSNRLRLAVDGACFAVISGYFVWQGIFPMFPPLNGDSDAGALTLRVVGGAWWLFGARLTVAFLWFTLHRDRRSRETRLFSDLSAAAIYVATGLVVLNSVFALPVTGVVATSGVVAIVLGLALQNTLADVFSGIAVGLEGPFHVGDRIQLNNEIEGLVVQANWRSIRVQTDGDDIAIIPNSVVAKAGIINRSSPSERRAASVELSCPEGAMPERVIETLMHATMLCPDILPMPGPVAVVTQLGARRNAYKITFYVATTKQLGSTKDTLLRAARRQLHYAGLLDMDRAEDKTRFDAGGDSLASRRLLRDAVLFEGLADEQITALARQLLPRRLEPGEVLFTQGEADRSLCLVASGVIEFSRLTAEAAETLGSIGAGEYIGEIGLLAGTAHAATAKARTHSLIYRLPHEALAPLFEQNAELVAAFDRSARKGLDILHREVAVRASPAIGGSGLLLTRIRSFFGVAGS
jgi:small-conductance mechanosensitive channel/CRP-like cAMP-binding protein